MCNKISRQKSMDAGNVKILLFKAHRITDIILIQLTGEHLLTSDSGLLRCFSRETKNRYFTS